MKPPSPLLRRLPFLLILAGSLVGVFLFADRLGFDALARHQAALTDLVSRNRLAASLGFVAVYIGAVMLSLPGATMFSVLGGLLFGFATGLALNLVAATTGAVLLFWAARAGFGGDLADRLRAGGGRMAALQAAIEQNQWSALLALRLMPVVPFFVVNLLAASVGVAALPFAVTTFFGILPAAVVITSVGAGFEDLMAKGETPDLAVLMSPAVLWPMLGLACLAALPAAARLWQNRRR